VSEPKQPSLSDDERVVILLVCEGLTNPEIAARLGIGEYVVAVRISYILHQLGLRNRVQLAVWAVKQGLY
jgi:DNA-binding NarL/FixJ family response regulator